jgi:hypothetical protein
MFYIFQIGDVQSVLEHIFHRSVVAGVKSNHGRVWPEGSSEGSSTGKPVDEDIELGGTAPVSEESLLGGNRAEKHFVLVKIKDRCDDTANSEPQSFVDDFCLAHELSKTL